MADEPQTLEDASVSEHAGAATPAAPPTSPDYKLMQGKKRETWTIVYGVIGILASVFAGFMGLSGVFLILGGQGMGVATSSPASPSPESMKPYMSALGWDYLVSGLLAGLLLAGAIGLLMRRRWSVRLLVTWSLLKFVAAIVFGVLIYQGFGTMMQATAAQSKAPTPMPTGMANMMSAVMAFFMSVMGCVLPTAWLIWFAVGPVREQVRAWK